MTWLAARGLLGLKNGYWLLFAVAGIVALVLAFTGALDRYGKTSRELGATQQREADLAETLERTETGNEARDEIRRDSDAGRGDALYAQCLRTARTPANCERFLPQR